MSDPKWFSTGDIDSLVTISQTIAAIEDALRGGLDPASAPARVVVDTRRGQLLLMPAEFKDSLGVKIATVAPANPALGQPRIQAIYLLLDGQTMTPVALMDGTKLTLLRTSAVSAVAAKYLARPDSKELLIFGSGPQARAHVDAMSAILPLENVSIVARTQPAALELAKHVAGLGMESQVFHSDDSEEVSDVVSAADLIVCATTSSTPLFDGRNVSDGTCVIAVGSHKSTERELDSKLVGRATVVVEDVTTALRECGDIIMAIDEGLLDESSLTPMRDLVIGHALPLNPAKPSVFKSSGMAWEDLVIAELIFRGEHYRTSFTNGG